jgi:hypothetical protein
VTVLPAGNNLRIDPRKLAYLLTSGKSRCFTSHGFSLLRPSELDTALRVHPLALYGANVLRVIR